MSALVLLGPAGSDLPAGIDLTEGDEYVLGRSRKGCAVVLNLAPPAPPSVISRKHARVYSRASRWYIEDLGSLNGLFVNDEQLAPSEPKEIRQGDAIRFGEQGRTLDPRSGADLGCIRYRFVTAPSQPSPTPWLPRNCAASPAEPPTKRPKASSEARRPTAVPRPEASPARAPSKPAMKPEASPAPAADAPTSLLSAVVAMAEQISPSKPVSARKELAQPLMPSPRELAQPSTTAANSPPLMPSPRGRERVSAQDKVLFYVNVLVENAPHAGGALGEHIFEIVGSVKLRKLMLQSQSASPPVPGLWYLLRARLFSTSRQNHFAANDSQVVLTDAELAALDERLALAANDAVDWLIRFFREGISFLKGIVGAMHALRRASERESSADEDCSPTDTPFPQSSMRTEAVFQAVVLERALCLDMSIRPQIRQTLDEQRRRGAKEPEPRSPLILKSLAAHMFDDI